MAAILTSQAQVPDADMPSLLATYQHYTGRAVARFASRAVAERRVVDAIMSSADARGHLGVPAESTPAPTAHADLVERAAATGRADPLQMVAEGLPGSQEGVEPAPATNPYPPGSLAHRLWAQAAGEPVPAAPSAERIAAVVKPREPRPADASRWVRATGGGSAKVLGTSIRGLVLARITASPGGACSMAALIAEFGTAAAGCVGKLRATGHIVDAEAPAA